MPAWRSCARALRWRCAMAKRALALARSRVGCDDRPAVVYVQCGKRKGVVILARLGKGIG